jgi:hypothetical protein
MRRSRPWPVGLWLVIGGSIGWWVVGTVATLAGLYALWARCAEAWR